MPNSLRSKLSKLRYKRQISDEEYRELIAKLDGHDKELLDKIKAEIINLTNGDMPERIWNSDVLEILDKYKTESEG